MSRFDNFEEESRILHVIAKKYPPSSREYVAIEHAALALGFAITEAFDDFSTFVQSRGQELSLEQKTHLKHLGIDLE